jgi:hypothetical protein
MSEAETRGIAILGMALGHASLTLLNAKGVISDPEIDAMFETILAGTETLLPADDPGVQIARKLAEELAQSVLRSRDKPTTEIR